MDNPSPKMDAKLKLPMAQIKQEEEPNDQKNQKNQAGGQISVAQKGSVVRMRFLVLVLMPKSIQDEVQRLLPKLRDTVRSKKFGSDVCDILAVDKTMLDHAKQGHDDYGGFKEAHDYCEKSTTGGKVGLNTDFEKLLFDMNHESLKPVVEDKTHFLLCGVELPNKKYPNLDVLGAACSRVYKGDSTKYEDIAGVLETGLKYECGLILKDVNLTQMVRDNRYVPIGRSPRDRKVSVNLIELKFSDKCEIGLVLNTENETFVEIRGTAVTETELEQDDLKKIVKDIEKLKTTENE